MYVVYTYVHMLTCFYMTGSIHCYGYCYCSYHYHYHRRRHPASSRTTTTATTTTATTTTISTTTTRIDVLVASAAVVFKDTNQHNTIPARILPYSNSSSDIMIVPIMVVSLVYDAAGLVGLLFQLALDCNET